MNDILLDPDYDALIEAGDFVVDESTYQHQSLLLMTNKGEFKEHPMRCVGAVKYLESGDEQAFAREIDVEFNLDGMKVDRISINIPNVEIEANYE